MQKKKICLFMRKPIEGIHFSIENFYYDLFKDFESENIEIVFKICPLISRGIVNRIFLCIWAFFNQGSINHICGDINYISIFMNKNKTINTFLDFYSMKRLRGLKRYIYFILWIKIPFIKSKKIITISNNTLKELKKFINIKDKKNIDTIGISASSDFKKKNKNKLNKVPKILIVGTAINKNIFNIIRSLKNISCELILVGKLNNIILQELKINKINYKNLFSIDKKKMIKLYIDCDMLLFPSNYEGFGMPILEAQSIGRAVITSKFEPMRSVAGKAAVFVNPKKTNEISKAVNEIIYKNHARNALIKKGYENIKRFKKEAILKKYLKIYNQLLLII